MPSLGGPQAGDNVSGGASRGSSRGRDEGRKARQREMAARAQQAAHNRDVVAAKARAERAKAERAEAQRVAAKPPAFAPGAGPQFGRPPAAPPPPQFGRPPAGGGGFVGGSTEAIGNATVAQELDRLGILQTAANHLLGLLPGVETTAQIDFATNEPAGTTGTFGPLRAVADILGLGLGPVGGALDRQFGLEASLGKLIGGGTPTQVSQGVGGQDQRDGGRDEMLRMSALSDPRSFPHPAALPVVSPFGASMPNSTFQPGVPPPPLQPAQAPTPTSGFPPLGELVAGLNFAPGVPEEGMLNKQLLARLMQAFQGQGAVA